MILGLAIFILAWFAGPPSNPKQWSLKPEERERWF